MTKTIAVLGLGAMGSRMAQRLLDAGFSVRVYTRSARGRAPLEAAGAIGFDSPRSAATGADVVLSMVRDDAASAAVWCDPEAGALAGMGPEAIAVECSTLSPAAIEALAVDAAARGVALVDAPVVGSRPQAEAGTLVFLASGSPTALERLTPVFGALGAAVHPLGPIGRGTVMKLAVNALFATQVAALAELLAALGHRGVDLGRALEVLGSLPVCSAAAKAGGALMIAERYEPSFPVELVAKDLAYARGLAAALPVCRATHDVFRRAEDAGLGGENLVAVAKLYRWQAPEGG